MFNTIVNGVREFFLTSCEHFHAMEESRAHHIELVGEFVCHSGWDVVVKLDSCGASDSHSFEHFATNNCDYINRMFEGKLIRLVGRRYYESPETGGGGWDYQWTISSVNLWEQGMNEAPDDIKRMCGTNC